MTDQERADRSARYAAAYHYPIGRKPGLTVTEQNAFADMYADRWHADGLTLAEAWKAYEADQG